MKILLSSVVALILAGNGFAQRQMERLSRGLVAVPAVEGGHLVSWRLFATDPDGITFNLYLQSKDQEPVRLNETPISGSTNFLIPKDKIRNEAQYFIRPIIDDSEEAPSASAPLWESGFLKIPIKSIKGYRPGDTSVADLDGDGDYEIVIQQSGQAHDNSHSGLTDPPVLDAYELDGTHLWRIELGKNIRDGEHYTQFMVYDLDGDGRAEVACKTADGAKDGRGKVVGDASKDWRTLDRRSKSFGRVLDGPEFLTIFDGLSGKELKTVDYLPNRYPINGWGGIGGNGGNDNYGNRCDRLLACVAYLDGKRPSLVMCRGVYGRTVLVAWDWRAGELTKRWVFDSGSSAPPYRNASPYSGMGGHSVSVADVDQDGRDEIVYQAMVIDDDGKGLHSSGLRHGDAVHVSDFDPARPGLEIFTVQENEGSRYDQRTPGAAMRDAKTGKILWSHSLGVDVGAGLVADIDPRHAGCEAWGGPGGLRTASGKMIGAAPQTKGFAIWWDGDLLRELFSVSRITKWDWEAGKETVVQELPPNRRRWNRNPCLVSDLVGDWREEVIVSSPDGESVLLYTTPIETEHRIPTLMHDPQYRLSIAWQNVVYNKPPQTGFFLGEGMSAPPKSDLRFVKAEMISRKPKTWQSVVTELLKTEKTGFGGLCGVVVDRDSGDVFINLSDRGIFRSSDGCKTWKLTSKEPFKGRTESPGCWTFDPTGKSKSMVAAFVYGAAISSSGDLGESFERMHGKSEHVDWCAIDWMDPKRQFVIALKHEQDGLLIASNDGGKTFRDVGKKFISGWVFDNKTAVVAQEKTEANPEPTFMRTSDGGKTFVPCGKYAPVGHHSARTLPKWYGGKLYWLTNKGLIFTSDKGLTWQTIAKVKEAAYGPIFGKDSKQMFLLTRSGIVESLNGGSSWSEPIVLPEGLGGGGNLIWMDYAPKEDSLYVMKMGSDLYRLIR